MIKKLALLLLLFFISMATLYLILISIISISTGLNNLERAGFWMPIVFGLLIFLITIFLIRLIVYMVRQIKTKEYYPPYTRRDW